MDKRALFLVPVVMALLGLLLVWLGWVAGDSPGAPIGRSGPAPPSDIEGPQSRGAADGALPEGAAPPGSAAEEQHRDGRRRVHAQPAADGPDGEEDGEEDGETGPSGTATDQPGIDIAYADAFVGRHRDDAHREKMTIVWPKLSVEAPPEDADVLLIEGYRGYVATRIVSNGDAVSGARVTVGRQRRGGRLTEFRVASAGFDVDATAFARAWHAVRLIEGARAEWKEPPPEIGMSGGRSSASSHAPHYWVRVRSGADEVLHASVTRSQSFSRGIRSWRQIQNRALHDLLTDLVPEQTAERPLDAWVPPMTREIAAATSVDEYDVPVQVLLSIAVPVVGEAGGREALAAVTGLEGHLQARALARHGGPPEYWEGKIAAACALARNQIGLRLDWSSAAALRVIHEAPREAAWGEDLIHWTRARLRSDDPGLYREMLRTDLLERHDDAPLMFETLIELRTHYGDDLTSALAPALASQDPDVRVSSALVLLDASPGAAAAIDVLDAVAADTGLHAPAWQSFQKTARARAVQRLIDGGHWDAGRMRRQFAASGEDGQMRYRLDLALTQAGAGLSDVERRDGYRAALEGRPDRGMLVAMERLIEIDDAPSFARIEARLTRYASAPEGEEDLLDRWARERLIPTLREKLAAARSR